ncbi:glycoside hydrolase family protein [Streptomyces fuscigenes]|uniref:glycoside hydrolase family protein n=1 Tax=Streptomyces fuscigenes TaxID=1528880 RepID=UPI001F19EF15|nr:glycoside hydrolase family protein [Streptomyces fuscigenes]MCF3960261.1 glycoside hydrolase family protein [Streptomyces fuscigenes]
MTPPTDPHPVHPVQPAHPLPPLKPAPSPTHQHPGKRVVKEGVGLNPAPGASKALAESDVSWYYNWTSAPGSVTPPKGIAYVPMIWGPGSVTPNQLSDAAKYGSQLLTFQEPDLATQSDMTVQQAVRLWPQLEKTGLPLSAPQVASGAATPGGWLDRFMKAASQHHLRVDFIPVHWFGGDFGPNATNELRDYLEAVHNRYHKPVWLTEYALTDYSQPTPRYPTPKQQADFVTASTTMLNGLDFVQRYAWFTLSTRTSPTGLYDGTTPNASGRAYRQAR